MTDWRQRLEAAVARRIPAADRLAARDDRSALHASRPAAVLIAVEALETPRIHFTQRSHALTHHPGQISFPGGRVEASDADPADAALRECEEEIGLKRAAVTLLGGLPSYCTVTGFEIRPFVGWVAPGQPLVPDSMEVEHIFSVPLAYAMDAAHYRRERRCRDGVEYRIYAIDFEGHHIWGATAGMLIDLAQRVALVDGRAFSIPEATGFSA